MTYWYRFQQYWSYDSGIQINENVNEFVFIQAESADQANSIAESFGIYFDSSENPRWIKTNESRAETTPTIYKRPPHEEVAYLHKDGAIIFHCFDGTKRVISKNQTF